MATLRAQEQATYDTIWAHPAYREVSPGETCVDLFLSMSGATPRESPIARDVVIDAGCGSGRGGLELARRGFDVILCDLTDAGLEPEANDLRFVQTCLWDPINVGFLYGGRADWVYCCDVLEHIPPTFAMLVISRLLEVTRKGLFLSIATQPDHFGAWVGKPLHQTVQSFVEWKRQLSELGTVVEARDLLNRGIYLVRPRC